MILTLQHSQTQPQPQPQLESPLPMPRPKNTVKTVYKNIGLPEDLVVRIEVHLFSELEGKIPFGAQQEFFEALVRDYFTKLDAAQAAVAAAGFTVADSGEF